MGLSLEFAPLSYFSTSQPASLGCTAIDILVNRFHKPSVIKQQMVGKMPRKAKELGPLDIKRLTKPGFYFVGGVGGLALQVLPTGSRSWVLRVMVGGKRRNMGLGGYPDVTLAGAREAARDARAKLSAGHDPIAERRRARLAMNAELVRGVTFKAAAVDFIAAREGSWRNDKHRYQWQATLETYAYPHIGDISIADLTLSDIRKVLNPIWSTKTETAKRLRGRIEQVIDFAAVQGHRDPGSNPARWGGNLDKVLPAPSKVAKVKHFEALPWQELPDFMVELAANGGTASRALEFAILCVARSGEVRGATWPELHLDRNLWVIPAGRMKAEREHRVPLTLAAIELLKALPRIGGDKYVFSGARGKMLSDMAMTAVLRRMGLTVVPHGFRSTFRDWVADETNHSSEVAEMALAHVIDDKTEAAYRRGDLLIKRYKLMEDWAAYCLSKMQT